MAGIDRFVATDEGALTAGQVRRRAEGVARSLEASGVPEGAVVCLVVPNGLELLPALLGLALRSCVAALTSPKLGAQGWSDILTRIAPAALLSTADLAPTLSQRAHVEPARAEWRADDGPFRVFRPVDRSLASGVPNEGVVLKFSSGSTGLVKGICLSVRNLLAEADTIVAGLDAGPGTRIIAPVPLFHSYGFDLGALAAIVSGARLHVSDGFVPRRTLRLLDDPAPAAFLGVPVMYRVLLEGNGAPLPPHRLISCTAPLDARTIVQFTERFGQPICQHYGASEVGGVTLQTPDDVLAHPDSVGRPMRNVSVRVVDPAGRTLGPCEAGEVVVRSGAVALGYVMGGPPGRSPLAGDSYAMGDLGVLDREGFLTVQGRLDDLINVGGFKVSPAEVRRVLDGHPSVRESAVTGHRDGRGEVTVYAMVSLRAPATEIELIRYCQELLAEYKVPRRIDVRAELPRGPSGKVVLTAEGLDHGPR